VRKTPKQARSRELVACLVRATRHAILLNGVGGVTTHLVARIAGVSPGSLYQYFENRDQLLEAVLVDVERDLSQLAGACIAEVIGGSDQATWIRSTIDRILDFHCSDDGLRLELAKSWADLPKRFQTEGVLRRVAEVLQVARAREWSRVMHAELDEVAFAFVNNAVVSLATMHRDGGSEHAKATIREALLRMLQGVLQKPGLAAR